MTEKLKELIEAAAKEALPPRSVCNPVATAVVDRDRRNFIAGATDALSNPDLIAEAGLVKKEEWIDVMERLPGKKQYVLLFGEGGRQFTALFDNGEFWAYNPFGDELEKCEAVTHWQPLPAPPSQLKK